MSLEDRKKGSHFRWSVEARQLVSQYAAAVRSRSIEKQAQRAELTKVITQLMELSGHPRRACWRFVRALGVKNKRRVYREWTRSEQQRLLDLVADNPPLEVAKIMRRSYGSIRCMLSRLGASAQMGRDWFTKYTLGEALHIRPAEVQRWIDQKWLKTRTVETGRLKKEIIYAEDFVEFCRNYSGVIVGNRLNTDRLDFVHNFVFPPSHVGLLPVRESKKERAAYDALVAEGRFSQSSETEDLNGDLEIA
jgi:hypothetical protein